MVLYPIEMQPEGGQMKKSKQFPVEPMLRLRRSLTAKSHSMVKMGAFLCMDMMQPFKTCNQISTLNRSGVSSIIFLQMEDFFFSYLSFFSFLSPQASFVCLFYESLQCQLSFLDSESLQCEMSSSSSLALLEIEFQMRASKMFMLSDLEKVREFTPSKRLRATDRWCSFMFLAFSSFSTTPFQRIEQVALEQLVPRTGWKSQLNRATLRGTMESARPTVRRRTIKIVCFMFKKRQYILLLLKLPFILGAIVIVNLPLQRYSAYFLFHDASPRE